MLRPKSIVIVLSGIEDDSQKVVGGGVDDDDGDGRRTELMRSVGVPHFMR
jgi:hypothetical protein